MPSRSSTLVRSFIACALMLAAPAAHASEVVEYYHQGLDHYFVTGYANEKQALDSGGHSGWVRTGQTFQVFNPGDARLAGSVPVCRFYGNPLYGLDSHFYSATPQECLDVKAKFANEWLIESDSVFSVHPVDPTTLACPTNTIPIYRLYNGRSDVNHRYTTDVNVVDAMLAKGYTLEGIGSPRPIVFCAANIAPPAPASGAPVCTVAVSTEFPILGVPLEMTATCSGSPTTYAWINCSSSLPTCAANSSVAGPVVYGIVATNAQGASAPVTKTLNWQPVAAAAPSCTVSASSSTPQLGSPLVLSATCTDNPVRFEWLSCSALTPDACVPVPQCAGATTTCSPVGQQQGVLLYSLRASNNAGMGAKASVTVNWIAGTGQPPPPGPSGAPVCTLIPSSTFPAVNTTLTLTVACTNAPTLYEWLNCTSSSNICTTTESTIGVRTYTAFGRNASGVSAPATVSVTWQVPPTGPPVCTLSANPANPYIGGTTLLTANCTQSPTSYNWTNCTNTTGNSCLAANSQLGSVTYSVTANNVFGPSAPASLTLNWGQPPPTGANFCGNFANVKFVDLVWGGQFTTNVDPNSGQKGFEDDMILVGRLRVPANATGTSSPGVVSAVEYINGPAARTMSLSPSSCDFRGFQPGVFPTPDPTGATKPMAWGFGINPSIQFALTGMPGGHAKLFPGETYYINIRNREFSSTAISCPTAECNMRITVNRPQ
jgi:Repeat of unknown function (DUF5648)